MQRIKKIRDVLFVATHKSHYANLALAQAIGARTFHIPVEMTKFSSKAEKIMALWTNTFSLPPNHEVYFTESTFYYPVLRKKLHMLQQGSKIVNLFATPLLYYLAQNTQIGVLEKFMVQRLLPGIDASVVLGDLGMEMAKKTPQLKDKPYIKASLWLSKSQRQKIDLAGVEYNPRSKNIFTVARFDWYYKGLDLVLQGFEKAWKEDKELNLYILGGGTLPDEVLDKIDARCKTNIHFPGYLDDTKYWKQMADFSLYVHMGRGDPFPMTVLESMCCGIPAAVSAYTGTKDAAAKLGKDFVLPLDAEAVGKKILDYISLDHAKKIGFSNASKSIAAEYSEESLAPKFANDFFALLEEI